MKRIKLFENFDENMIIKVGIDIDGTINNMVDAYNELYQKYFPNNKVYKADIWDWYQQMEYDGENPKEWFESHKAEVFETCKPYPGAVNTISKIYDYVKSQGYDLYIVTNQPTPEAKVAAQIWLDENGFQYDKVFFAEQSAGKWKYADIMIDDGIKVLNGKPDDKVSIKVSHPWNDKCHSDFLIHNITELTVDLIKEAIEKFIEKN